MADRGMAAGLPEHYLSPRQLTAAETEDLAVDLALELSLSDDLEPPGSQQQRDQQQQQQQQQREQQWQRPAAGPEEERRPAEGLVSGAAPTVLPRPHRRLVGIFDHQAGDGAVSPPPRPGPPVPASDGPALLTAADWGAATEPRPDYGDGEAAPSAAPPPPARPSGRRRWRRPAPAGWCSDDSNTAEAAVVPRRRELPDDASVTSVDSEAPPPAESRGTSPSVLSTGSVASSRRLEWDAAADVGYQAAAPLRPADSLSTLERIAIGSYAGVLRSEPEGTGRPAAPRRRHRPLLCRTGHHQEPIAEEAERRRGSHEPSPAALPSSEEDGSDGESDRPAGRRSVPRDGSVRRSQKRSSRGVSPRQQRQSPGRRPRPVSAEVHRHRRGRLTAKKSSSLSELSASPQQPRQPLRRRSGRDSRDPVTLSPPSAFPRRRDALTSASSSSSSSGGDQSDSERRCSNALFFTSSDTLVALPGHVPLPVALSKLDSSLSQSSPNSSLPLSGGSLKHRSSEQNSKQSVQTVIFVSGGGSEEAENCAGARPPDSDRSAAAGAATTSGRSSLDQLPTRDTGRPAPAPAMSYIETSEGSCYSSVYAAVGGGGTQLLSSSLHDPSASEFTHWAGRGSSSLTGASSSAASASRAAYSSAASVSREGYGGAPCSGPTPGGGGRGGGGGLLVEERTRTIAEEKDTGRRVTETVRRALADRRNSDTFRDALECSDGSEQVDCSLMTLGCGVDGS